MSTNVYTGPERRHADLNIPIPDPSVLTTEALDRENKHLRELLEVKLGSSAQAGDLIRTILETRFAGMDKAIELLQSERDKLPSWVDEKITALGLVTDQKLATHAERFASIQKQFDERDVRTDQAAGAVKIAVDAALQAQKEAASEQNKANTASITKSEAGTTKQIDAQGTLIQKMSEAFDGKIADVKERLVLIQGVAEGGKAMWGYAVGGVGLIAALYFGFSTHQAAAVVPPPPQVIYVPAPVGTQLPVTPPSTVPR